MSGRAQLDPSIDIKHWAAFLEASPGSLTPLVTRVANANWQIHPGWVDRYYLLLSFMLLISDKCETMLLWANLNVLLCEMQVEVGWAFTFRASSRGNCGVFMHGDRQLSSHMLSGQMEARDPHVSLSMG